MLKCIHTDFWTVLTIEYLAHEQTSEDRFLPQQEVEANRVDVRKTRTTLNYPNELVAVHAPLPLTPCSEAELANVV